MRIVIPDDAPSVMEPSAAFGELRGQDVACYADLPGSEERLAERIGGAEAVINIRASTRFTRAVLEQCRALRVLSIWGTGTDHVDLEAARELGIAVVNTPGVAAPAIAEHCLALLFAVARRLMVLDAAVRRGEWPRGQSMELRGKTLGIVGLGAIGQRFAGLGAAIGMKAIAWTRTPKPETGIEHVTMDELLWRSDVVSLHLRLTPETRHFLGERELRAMRPGAILINTARGAVVDEGALVAALREGRIGGAGLDVLADEPPGPGNPLLELTNVVLTPHCAGITPETTEAGLRMAIANALREE